MNRNEANKEIGNLGDALSGSAVSRRWLLRNSANAAAGVLAVSAFGQGAHAANAKLSKTSSTAIASQDVHMDAPAGYVHSLHGWDTI